MARLKHGILGGLSGSIAALNCYSNYKKDCIRLKSTTRLDAKSQSQLDNRLVFKQVNDFLKPIYHQCVKVTLSYTKDSFTPWFLFYKLNSSLFDASGLVIPESLRISAGSLLSVQDFTFDFVGGTGIAQFSWTNNADDSNGFDNDIFFGFVYNRTLASVQLFESHPARSTEKILQQFPAGWLLTHSFSVYTCFVKWDLLSVSDTSYLAL